MVRLSWDRGERTTTDIVIAVEDWFGLPRGALRTNIRHRDYVRARHVAMYLARSLTGASYPQLAQAFNRRDHTTVMHAVRKVGADRDLLACAAEIETLLVCVADDTASTEVPPSSADLA